MIIVNKESDNQVILFQIINFFLDFYEIPEPENILSIILREILSKYKDYYDYCETWISKLLKLQIESISYVFLDYFSEQTDFLIIERLIQSILIALRDNRCKNVIQRILISKGFLKHLQNSLPNQYDLKENLIKS